MKVKNYKKLEIGTQVRSFSVDPSNIDVENRLVKIALSSEEPYQRWFGIEILSHATGDIDLTRLLNGAPLLAEHDPNRQIGKVESATVDKDKVLRCVVRFSKNPFAQEYFNDVVDGIRTKVSVGYQINGMTKISSKFDEVSNEEVDTYLVDDWQPYEGSIVSIPADDTVGVGRSLNVLSLERTKEKNVKTIDVKELDTEEELDEEKEDTKTADEMEEKKGGKTTPADLDNDDDGEEEDEEDEDDEDRKKSLEVKDLVVPAVAVSITNEFDKGKLNTENNNNQRNNNKMDKELIALGKQYGELELAVDFAEKGLSVSEFQGALLEKMKSKASKVDVGTEKELDKFDVSEYLKALAEDDKSNKMYAMAREFDQEHKGQSKQGGFVLPRRLLQKAQKDYNVGTPANGGNLAPNVFRPELIGALYNNSVVLGFASVYPSATGSSQVQYPIQTGKNSFGYLAENQRATETNQTTDFVTFTPKTIGGRAVASRAMMKESAIPTTAYIVNGLLASFDEWRDNELLNGSGASGHILGIFNQTGVNVVTSGAVAGGLTYKKIIELESDIAYANANNGRMQYLTNAKVAGQLKGTQMFANFGGPILSGNTMNGMNVNISNQIVGASGNQGLALVNGEHIHYIEWDGYELVANEKRLGAGQVEFELFATCDFQVSRPKGISLCTDIVLG